MSRKNISLTKPIDERAAKLIEARGFTGLSDLIAVLVREEFERRGLTIEGTIRETPAPYHSQPSKPGLASQLSASSAEDARDVAEMVNLIEKAVDQKHPARKTGARRRAASGVKAPTK